MIGAGFPPAPPPDIKKNFGLEYSGKNRYLREKRRARLLRWAKQYGNMHRQAKSRFATGNDVYRAIV
jgi:hypothetical protein